MAVTPYPAHIPVLSACGNLEPSSQPHALSSKNIFREPSPTPPPLSTCAMSTSLLSPATPTPPRSFSLKCQLRCLCLFTLSGSWLHQPEHNAGQRTLNSQLHHIHTRRCSPSLPRSLSRGREPGEGMWVDGSHVPTTDSCAPAELALGSKGLLPACTCGEITQTLSHRAGHRDAFICQQFPMEHLLGSRYRVGAGKKHASRQI